MNVWFAVLWIWQAAPAAPAPPGAQARAQIAQQIRAAGENLDLADYKEAIAGLGRALNQIRQAQLTKDPIAAKAEALLGATLVLADKPNEAVAHFRAALRIDSQVKVETRFWKPPVQKAFEAARSQVAPAPAQAAASPPPAEAKPAHKPALAQPPPEDDKSPVVGIRARALAAPEAGRVLPMQAKVGADVGTPAKVMLFYRATGGSKFTEVVMAAGEGGYKAAIPAGDVKLPALQYYVEARDAKNRPLARRGNPDRPLAMPVTEPEAPAPAAVPAVAKKAKKVAPAPEPAPAAAAKPKKKAGEDEENPFDEEHDPTKVVPKAPTK